MFDDEPSEFQEKNNNTMVLEEQVDLSTEPSEEDVIEHAKWLGMNIEDDFDLLWIAKEGLSKPLPDHWKPCKSPNSEEVYYFNFLTGESTWDHPVDTEYKQLYAEVKQKRQVNCNDSKDKQLFKQNLMGNEDCQKLFYEILTCICNMDEYGNSHNLSLR